MRISVMIMCLTCVIYTSCLKHCQVTPLPKDLLKPDVMNVIYTMESTCKMCTKQVLMFDDLNNSLEDIGIKTHFTVGMSDGSERLPGLVPHISVNKRQIWKALGEQNGHFYIIDRCGRMVYEIIKPWSDLNMPFVRAAIISTQYSHPCGLCLSDNTNEISDKIEVYPPMEERVQATQEGEVPLRVVMRSRHMHEGNPTIYNHIVMISGVSGHHEHLPYEKKTEVETMQEIPKVTTNIVNNQEMRASANSNHGDTTSICGDRTETTEVSANTKSSRTTGTSTNSENSDTTRTYNYGEIQDTTSESSVIQKDGIVYTVTSGYSEVSLTSTANERSSTKNPMDVGISISTNNLMKDNQLKDLKKLPTINLDERKHSSIENIENSSQNEEQIEHKLNSSENELQNDNSSEYFEDGEDQRELTYEEQIEKENLKEHYKKLLDWINYER